jgi:hypothetical protein
MLKLVAIPTFFLFFVAADCQVGNPQEGGVSYPAAPPDAMEMTLPQAMNERIVDGRLEGTGGASGSVMDLHIKRISPANLSLAVPTGLVVHNPSATEQDLVLRGLLGPPTVVLVDDAWHVFNLEGYCLQADLDNPSEGSGLTLGEKADARVVAVLEAISQVQSAEGNTEAIQAAVWAVTDDISLPHLEELDYRLSDDDLLVARWLIKAAGLDPSTFSLFN